jgi:rhodanese-related sulfurtransferase
MTRARTLDARALRAMLVDGAELALLDVREERIFSESHLLFARSVPLSRLELRMARLVPRLTTRLVLVDAADGLAERAAAVLARAGYSDLQILAGGIAAWEAAGFELFSGVNVPSKAFGEFVEHESHTPSISAQELHDLMQSGTDMVVLDSRPYDEYSNVSIPTSVDVPGAELVLRVHDIAPKPDTLVVVNCAGRTRSIIGAQSLINAGVPNKVVALRNGTMGWSLAGFTPDSGKDNRAPAPTREGLAWAKSAAANVARKLDIQRIDEAKLAQLRADDSRTLYLFDVRDPADYAAGHVAGALSAPGGQLVQATDQYAGTLNARIVLVDDKEVRAVMTASWLRQMGWTDVFVLVAQGSETSIPDNPVLGTPALGAAIKAAKLDMLLARNEATVVDLSLSRNYAVTHIPGAWFAIRARLAQFIQKTPLRRNVG